MNPNLRSEVDPSCHRKGQIFFRVIWFFTGYFAVSSLTLPFIARFWWWEIPLLALIQLPKTELADWLRANVMIKVIRILGYSRGSFSPDFMLARPYALAIVYLVVMAVVGGIALRRFEFIDPRRGFAAAAAFLISAIIDYVLTLIFGSGRILTIY